MAEYIPDEIVEEVRQRNEISSVIASYLPLKRSGRSLKALCPFHSEKTPSFNINKERQIYHCFGCGKGGNVFTFVMEMDRLSFPEVVRQLAQRAGVTIPESATSADRDITEQKEILYRANEWACACFQESLVAPEGAKARTYLANRGISEESIGQFRLGYAPNEWDTLLKKMAGKETYVAALRRAGLLVEKEGAGGERRRYYDRFRNRVVFPIIDLQNRVVGFGARSLDGSEPKYLNSPETPVFHKGRVLYGLPFAKGAARETGRLVITEGYTDVIMAHQNGFENFVAGLGTALTPQHVGIVRRFADEAVVLYDGDIAGRNAARRAVELFLTEEAPARFAGLPAGEDPCSLLEGGGNENLKNVLETAKGPIDFLLQPEADGTSDEATTEQKASLVKDILAMVAQVRGPVMKELLLKDVAEKTGLAEEAIRRQMTAIRPIGTRQAAEQEEPRRMLTKVDEYLLEAVLMAPPLREQIAAAGIVEKIADPEVRDLCQWALRKDDINISDAISRANNPDLVKRIIGFENRTGESVDYEKSFHECLRLLDRKQAAPKTEKLHRDLRRAQKEGDEAREIELLKESQRVNDSRIRSMNGRPA